MSIQAWWGSGQRLTLRCGGAERAIFVRETGSGPVLTLLHGYPSCSYDWARVAAELEQRYRLLMPDLLGFGDSEKPADHDYTIDEQADLVESLWRAAGVSSTALLVHDYSVSLAQELLARNAERRLEVELEGVTFANGGLYPELHRPQPIQLALLDPEQGPQVSAAVTEELIRGALAPTFAAPERHAQDCADIWHSIIRGIEVPVLHQLIAYIPDRVAHRDRWVGALEQTSVPLAFVWGMLDPISGAHIAERIAERLPDALLVTMEDVCHWPPLEAADRITAAIA